jgi:hypothetical protein
MGYYNPTPTMFRYWESTIWFVCGASVATASTPRGQVFVLVSVTCYIHFHSLLLTLYRIQLYIVYPPRGPIKNSGFDLIRTSGRAVCQGMPNPHCAFSASEITQS